MAFDNQIVKAKVKRVMPHSSPKYIFFLIDFFLSHRILDKTYTKEKEEVGASTMVVLALCIFKSTHMLRIGAVILTLLVLSQ